MFEPQSEEKVYLENKYVDVLKNSGLPYSQRS